MDTPEQFDVFQDHPWEPRRVASFDEFAAAIAAMEKMASENPGQHFVWSVVKEEIMAQLNSRAPRALRR
jgi:hypothetical protein